MSLAFIVQQDKDLTRPENVENLYKNAKEGDYDSLEACVTKQFGTYKNINDDEIKIITHFLKYTLLKHGDAERKTGRLYSGHPLDVARLLAGILGDKVTYLDIITAFMHDIPEETYHGENRFLPSDIKDEFKEYIEKNITKNKQSKFLKDADGLEFMVGKLTKYNLETNKARSYPDFIANIKHLTAEQKKKGMNKYIVPTMIVKGVDIIANLKELDDIKKGAKGWIYSKARKVMSIFPEREHKTPTNPLSQKIQDLEELAYQKMFKNSSHELNLSVSIPNEQKLFTIYKAFRIVDEINKTINERGYDESLEPLNEVKQNIILQALMRIQTQENHLLKYHCEGYNRHSLDTDIMHEINKIGAEIFDSKYKKIELEISKKADHRWLIGKQKELDMDSEQLSKKVIQKSFYRTRWRKKKFDVFDKVYLDNKFEGYKKTGWLFRENTDRGDKITHPFDILAPIYNKIIHGQKEIKNEIKGDHKEQYVHLEIFKSLFVHYQSDILQGDKYHPLTFHFMEERK
ncbi:MAG: hypothetical protein ABH828_04065 [archaeon]